MVSEDALAAAKAAALQDLTQLPTSRASRRTRRRPRRRGRPSKELLQPNGDALVGANSDNVERDDAVEYVPEAIGAIVAAARAEGESLTDGPVVSSKELDEIESVFKRFAERGGGEDVRDAAGTELEEGEEDQRIDGGTVASATQRGSSEGNDAEEQEANETGEEKEKGKENGGSHISRRQRKEQQRNLISRLKALSDAPDVVESWDVTAPDPVLLVHLKAWPNSVAVPSNWRQKRKYLQNKRGMEKRAFQLPAYIMATGVGELRDAQIEADEKKSLKQRQREKMRAKTGRGVDIDHGRLHDAFFKFQVKPRLTGHGDIYYELRELEVDHSKFRPGVLSDALCAALDMAVGDPPPWLVNMQRYGPPPGYPGLKIPGLNAPIPPGARFGYQPGGWGKPPVDEHGQPLYGDVFGEGLEFGQVDERFDLREHEKAKLWGAVSSTPGPAQNLMTEDEDQEKESEDEEQATKPAQPEENVVDANKRAALPPPVSAESVDPRKGIPSGQLYKVLEERRVSVGEKAMMGSSHVYNVKENADSRAKEDQQDVGEKRKRQGEGADPRRALKKQKEFKF